MKNFNGRYRNPSDFEGRKDELMGIYQRPPVPPKLKQHKSPPQKAPVPNVKEQGLMLKTNYKIDNN